jgi:hypothetical protein
MRCSLKAKAGKALPELESTYSQLISAVSCTVKIKADGFLKTDVKVKIEALKPAENRKRQWLFFY